MGTPFGTPHAAPRPRPESRARSLETRWHELVAAAHHGSAPRLEHLAATLAGDDPAAVSRAGETMLVSLLGGLWRDGWQPAEVVRQVQRQTTRTTAGLLEIAVHVDHARRAGQALDPRWVEQLAELGGRRTSTSDGWLARWGTARAEPAWGLVQAARALAVLTHLPSLDVLVPPPGAGPGTRVRGTPLGTDADDPVLRRVRKLLDKAESTTFDHEADSLTAKAHELMTKHAIDQAALGDPTSSETPGTIRVAIDAPYADAKSLLLQIVATNHRCRAVFHPRIDLSSVLGFPGDLRAVELTFTSLLVQAQHALAARAGGARTRSSSYRAAFYLAYASRIGERLREVTTEVLAAAGDGAHLPVLRAREESVAEAFDVLHGGATQSSRVRGGYDPLGHAHGRQAAEAARFGKDALMSG